MTISKGLFLVLLVIVLSISGMLAYSMFKKGYKDGQVFEMNKNNRFVEVLKAQSDNWKRKAEKSLSIIDSLEKVTLEITQRQNERETIYVLRKARIDKFNLSELDSLSAIYENSSIQP
jgi:hypothetical protein